MGDKMKPFDDILILDALKIVALRTRDNRIGDAVNLRRSEDEFDMFRWFFQSFEKSIECSFREHMHLVDNVHLVWGLSRLKLSSFDHIPDIVDSCIGSGINLDNIEKASILRIATVLALSTRIPVGSKRKTVHSLGKYSCNGRLSCSARSMKEICAYRAILQKGILQNLSNEGLSEKRMKIFGSVFLIERHYCRENRRFIQREYMDEVRKTKFNEKDFSENPLLFRKISLYTYIYQKI